MDYEFWCDEERLGRNRNPEDKKYIDNYTKKNTEKNTEKYIQHRVLADISTIIGLFAALYISIFSK